MLLGWERFGEALVDGGAVGVGAVCAVVDGLGGGGVDFGVVVDVGVGLDEGAGDAVVLEGEGEDFVGER